MSGMRTELIPITQLTAQGLAHCKLPVFYVSAKSLQSCLPLVTPWTVAHQAPLSPEFSRQESWSGLSCPPPGDLPDPGIEPESLTFTALAGGFFTTSATWEAQAFNKCKLLILFSLLDIEE